MSTNSNLPPTTPKRDTGEEDIESWQKVKLDHLLNYLLSLSSDEQSGAEPQNVDVLGEAHMTRGEHAHNNDNTPQGVEQVPQLGDLSTRVQSPHSGNAPHKVESAPHLLHKHLADVIDLANDSNLRAALEKCQSAAGSSIEKDLYAPLVALLNLAMDGLENKEFKEGARKQGEKEETRPGSTSPSSTSAKRVVFVYSREKLIRGYEDVEDGKPDIVLVSFSSASNVYKLPMSGPRKGYADTLQGKYPGSLDWSEVLLALEVERPVAAKKIPELPPRFTVPRQTGSLEGPLDSLDQTQSQAAVAPASNHSPLAYLEPAPVSSRANSRSSRKRKLDDGRNGSESKQGRENRYDLTYPERMAYYGAWRLTSLPVVTHAVHMLVHRDQMSLWWHDRQGTLESEQISYIQEFPRLLVLLSALLRFRQPQWGVPDGYPTTKSGSNLPLHFPGHTEELLEYSGPSKMEIGECYVTPDWTSPIMKRFQLHGRATRVFDATVQGRQQSYVIKVSHPEKGRVPEAQIVRIARTRQPKSFGGKQDCGFDLKKHLPDVICSKDVEGSDTGRIRQALGLEGVNARRVCRLLVSEKLEPITNLVGWELMRGWCHVIHCHYLLWTVDVHHGDPSVGNMAVRREGDQSYGVLVDWDLATIKALSEHLSDRRTGTIPFMAIDTLCDHFWQGHVPRVYRHELEGYLWVLPWVFCQCQKPMCTGWKNADVSRALGAKLTFRETASEHIAPELWKEQWPLVKHSMRLLQRLGNLRQLLPYPKPSQRSSEEDATGSLYRSLQLPDTITHTSAQLEYLSVWRTMARCLPSEWVAKLKDEVALDVDLRDDSRLDEPYLALFR